jgi:hypothetical protein
VRWRTPDWPDVGDAEAGATELVVDVDGPPLPQLARTSASARDATVEDAGGSRRRFVALSSSAALEDPLSIEEAPAASRVTSL